MSQPLIACLCPTYKRPQHLANAAACFLAQDYFNKRLLILDDAGQFSKITKDDILLCGQRHRYSTLPRKFNAMAALAMDLWHPDIFAIWEDDDVYLPWHLSDISKASQQGNYFVPTWVLSNCDMRQRGTRIEETGGRFHGATAFTAQLWKTAGGWPDTDDLLFDQKMRQHYRTVGQPVDYHQHTPSYVYRWGNGIYHGSQAGDAGFKPLWDELEKLPTPYIGELIPKFDEETLRIYEERNP